jgi:hypothetical protein
MLATPVTLPPGRLRLCTSPVSSGAPAGAMMIGMVVVAAIAARTEGVKWATIASTRLRARSAACSALRAGWPSA